MKISRLIAKLENIKAKYGDLEIVSKHDTYFAPKDVTFTSDCVKVIRPKSNPKLKIDV